VNSLPKAVTRQHHGCDLNPGSSAPESSMLTMWLPRNPSVSCAKMARPIDYRDDVWGCGLEGTGGTESPTQEMALLGVILWHAQSCL